MPILQKKMKDSDWSFEELQSKAQWELNWIEDDIFQRFVKNNPDIMLMCHKVTRKNLIDSNPLFRYYLTHTLCNFFVKPIDSDTSEEI